MSPLFAVAAISGVFGVLFLMLAAETPGLQSLQTVIYNHAQKAMMVVAVTATCASLYYSEIVEFVPCEFCWFQRIAMYPLAAILVVAVATRDRIDPRYIMVLALCGLGLSCYQYQLQLFPDQTGVCNVGVSCAGKYVNEFGFVTIPFMAGCGFLTIILLQIAEWRIDYLFRKS